MVALARRLLLTPTREVGSRPRPRLSVGGFALGSLLVHVGLWAALSTVQAMSNAPAMANVIEFTIAAPEPEPTPVVEPEPAPEPVALPEPVAPVVRHAPRPRPVVARPAPAPAPPPAEPAPSEGSALPEAVAGGSLALGRPEGSPAGNVPAMVAPAPPTPAPAPQSSPGPDLRAMARGYLRDLTRVLHGRRDYPRAALQQRLQGTVLLSITIDPSGHIVDVAVKRSSGHALLDRAAIASVRRTRSLPAAPDALAWQTRAVTLPVAYVLN